MLVLDVAATAGACLNSARVGDDRSSRFKAVQTLSTAYKMGVEGEEKLIHFS